MTALVEVQSESLILSSCACDIRLDDADPSGTPDPESNAFITRQEIMNTSPKFQAVTDPLLNDVDWNDEQLGQ